MKPDSDFRSINLKPSYYTSEDEIGQEFYTPVLSRAVRYDRVSGYFSSKALAAYSRGIHGLLKNHGKMKLIISHEISEEDYNLIREGYEMREDVSRTLLGRLRLDEGLTDEEMKDFCNLAHLIACGAVDIKIAFKKSGLFHSKFGLMEDSSGEVIYFTGSNNETQAAIQNNFESFDITTTWLSSDFDKFKIDRARKEFDTLWENRMGESQIVVREIEELIIKEILKYDRGEMMLDKEMLQENTMILTIEDEVFILYDNVAPGKLRKRELTIETKLKPYYAAAGYPYFRENLTYMEMQKIISSIMKLGDRRGFDVIVTRRLKEYLENQAYWIEEQSQYALILKTLDERIENRYREFAEIVNKEMERPLREKQLHSAFYMVEMKKAANFSVPGAGKTSMIYGAYAYLSSSEISKIDKLVMIGPKNTFLAWKEEFKANFGDKRELRILNVHDSEDPLRRLKIDGDSFNLILINYESLHRYERVLSEVIDESTMLVFDEVHKIKGTGSKRAEAAKRIAPLTAYKYVLTGTPIPNTYEDIYNFLHILYGAEYKSFFNFRLSELKNPTASKVEEINTKLNPFFWRTTKQELSVPDAEPDTIYHVESNDLEQSIIDLIHQKYAGNPFSLYIRLIQASTCPELLLKAIDCNEMYGNEDDETINWFSQVDERPVTLDKKEVELLQRVPVTSKFNEALSIVSKLMEESKTAIVWCMFVHTIDRMHRELIAKGIRAEVIYGSTPLEERERIIKLFQEKKLQVIVTNPHTLAESVSLHHACHDAIYLEYSFNLTHMLQSRDRIHRLGLPAGQETRYHYLMMKGQTDRYDTVDEKIYDRLKVKEKRMLDAIENGVLEPDPTVDYDEIISLFE